MLVSVPLILSSFCCVRKQKSLLHLTWIDNRGRSFDWCGLSIFSKITFYSNLGERRLAFVNLRNESANNSVSKFSLYYNCDRLYRFR